MSFSQVATANDGLDLGRRQSLGKSGSMFPLGLFRRIGKYRRCQREYRRVLELPDYLLQDIGFTRSQIIAATRRRHF